MQNNFHQVKAAYLHPVRSWLFQNNNVTVKFQIKCQCSQLFPSYRRLRVFPVLCNDVTQA